VEEVCDIHQSRDIPSNNADANTDGDHRYLLFSATFPKRLKKLAAKFLANDHVHISIGRTGSVHVNVKQQVWTSAHALLSLSH
jgi:ATP-dependent RNA helicase DDX3X